MLSKSVIITMHYPYTLLLPHVWIQYLCCSRCVCIIIVYKSPLCYMIWFNLDIKDFLIKRNSGKVKKQNKQTTLSDISLHSLLIIFKLEYACVYENKNKILLSKLPRIKCSVPAWYKKPNLSVYATQQLDVRWIFFGIEKTASASKFT